MRAITKVYLSLAVLLTIAAGANQYWAWTKIQHEEQTVPFRAQVEEEIKSQNLPYLVKDADIKEYANALGANLDNVLTAKDPVKFLHALSHQNGEKIISRPVGNHSTSAGDRLCYSVGITDLPLVPPTKASRRRRKNDRIAKRGQKPPATR